MRSFRPGAGVSSLLQFLDALPRQAPKSLRLSLQVGTYPTGIRYLRLTVIVAGRRLLGLKFDASSPDISP